MTEPPIQLPFEPKPCRLSREDFEGEQHDVPFRGGIPVDIVGPDSLMRETLAQFWEPNYDTVLGEICFNALPQGIMARFPERKPMDFPISVKVILTYPVTSPWAAEVKIPAYRLGEIFGIANDMYRFIYKADDIGWAQDGHREAPRMNQAVLNRARGKYVWGHDIGDLVFEYVSFVPNPKWPTDSYKRMQIIMADTDDPEELKQIGKNTPHEPTPGPQRLSLEEHGETCPFIGTFFFGIGS